MLKKFKEYEGSKNVVLEDEETGMHEITLKWDGSIDYRLGANGIKPSEDPTSEENDYIHISDIDDFIAKLQEIKEYGKKHFNNEYWK